MVSTSVTYVDLTFSESINSATFGADDVVLIGPDALPITVGAPQSQGGNVWRVSFTRQTAEGDYQLTVGPNIEDHAGHTLVAAYEGSFNILHCNLTPSNLQVPVEGWTGQEVEVRWTVTNTGAGPADGNWYDSVYLSDDDQIYSDTRLYNIVRPITLEPGEYYDRIVNVTIPDVEEGDYWIVVRTDAGGAVWPETDETDNAVIAGPFPVYHTPCPDLEPSGLVITSVPVLAGGTAYADWIVTNIGDGATNTPFWSDRIYLSIDQNLSSNDAEIEPDFQNPMVLNPAEGYAQAAEFTVPVGLLGDYYVIVETDANNELDECDEDNNIVVSSSTLEVQYAEPPILVMTNCAVDPPEPWPGDTVTVTWNVTNTGELSTGPINFDHSIIFSQDPVIDLNAGDVGLAWHVGALSTTLDAGETSQQLSVDVDVPEDLWGDYYIIVWPDPGQFLSMDRIDCAILVPLQAGLPADLEVEEVAVPETALSGQPIDVTWTVRNASLETTHVSWWDDKLYLSRDDSLETTGDNLLMGTYRHNGVLEFDDTYTSPESGTITLPEDADGQYYFIVQADVPDRVYEGEWEANNIAAGGPVDVTYAPPDLQVGSVDVSQDGSPVVSMLSGTNITVQWEVINDGTSATTQSQWYDRVYISADAVLDVATDRLLTTRSHSGALGIGASYTASSTVTVPLDYGGAESRVFVLTDADSVVHELDDDNNSAASYPFEVIWAPPDLNVIDVDVTTNGPGQLVSGTTVAVTWTVRNDYLSTTPLNYWYDRVYLSTDAVLDESDKSLYIVYHGGGLAPGQSYTNSVNVYIPIDYVGPTWYLLVKTDYTEWMHEYDYSNNVGAAGPYEIVWCDADLYIDQVWVDNVAVAGSPLWCRWRVRNNGGATTEGIWRDRVYVSEDRWLSADDFAFEPSIVHTGNLGYNSAYLGETTLDVPPGLSGNFYLIFEADTDNEVAERNEGNNTVYSSLMVASDVDLQVTAVDAPATALSGQNTSLSWTVANMGEGTSSAYWRDAVYLSVDQFLDTNADHYVGYFVHRGALNPAGEDGDRYTSTETVKIPSGLSGPYYVFVATDINNNVIEENDTGDAETNNAGFDGEAALVELPQPSDLVVSAIDISSNGFLGEDITVTWTVRNDETVEAAGSWHDSAYISADAAWDISDRKIGTVAHTGPLAAGAEYATPEVLTAPLPGVVPGDYHILVRTDVYNEVRETIDGELNNTAASTTQINVGCWELPLDQPDDTHTLDTGSWHYFMVPDVTAGEDLMVALDSADDSASTELYLRYGAIPDRGHYDAAYTDLFQADHEVILPGTQAGAYYLLVIGDNVPAAPMAYEITARLLPFEVRELIPSQGGNVGKVTVHLKGGQLTEDTAVRLVSTGKDTIEGDGLILIDATELYVTFDLAGAEIGPYDVEIEKPGELPAVLAGGFEVVTGVGPRFDMHLSLRSNVRYDAECEVLVQYTNVGDVDAQPPLLVVWNTRRSAHPDVRR